MASFVYIIFLLQTLIVVLYMSSHVGSFKMNGYCSRNT